MAEIVGEYLRKGSQIYIEGRLQTRKWQDKEGQDRYTTEIVASEMQMLGGRGGDQGGSSGHSFSGQSAAQAGPAQQKQAPPIMPIDDFDDDIPF